LYWLVFCPPTTAGAATVAVASDLVGSRSTWAATTPPGSSGHRTTRHPPRPLAPYHPTGQQRHQQQDPQPPPDDPHVLTDLHELTSTSGSCLGCVQPVLTAPGCWRVRRSGPAAGGPRRRRRRRRRTGTRGWRRLRGCWPRGWHAQTAPASPG